MDSTWMRHLEYSNSWRQEVEWWSTGEGKGELLFNGFRVLALQNESVLGMDDGDGRITT